MSESSRCVWVIFFRAGAVLPFIAVLGESSPLFEVRWDAKRFEGLFTRVAPCHVGAAQRPGVRHPSGREFARYASHGHARNVAGPSKDAVRQPWLPEPELRRTPVARSSRNTTKTSLREVLAKNSSARA